MDIFGPLGRQALIPASALAETVRRTAIEAHRAAIRSQFSQGFMENSQNYADRRSELHTAIKRHTTPNATFESFLHSIYGLA